MLYKLFKAKKYDIVHVHTPIASIIARIACKMSGVQMVIYTAHGFYFHEKMSFHKFWFFVFLEKISGFMTDILFTQSYEDKQSAIKFKFLPKDRIFYIGNGVDIERFNPSKIKNKLLIKKSINIPYNSFVIGSVCRLVKEKGLIEFFDSAINISKKYKNVYFVIVGERLLSDHNEKVTKYITKVKSELGERIIFLGKRNDIPEILSILNLYCLTSWREGMPRSIIEAMMMSKPVLATNIRGSREQVVNEKTGVIVPIKSSKDLEREMIRFIENKQRCREFGKEGRKKALEFYDEKKIVDLQVDIINKQIKKLNFTKTLN